MSSTQLVELLLAAGSAAGAATALGGVGWWLVGPRVRAGLETAVERVLADELAPVARQLDDHDRRLARVELAVHRLLNPSGLVELVELLDAVARHSPPPPPPREEP